MEQNLAKTNSKYPCWVGEGGGGNNFLYEKRGGGEVIDVHDQGNYFFKFIN